MPGRFRRHVERTLNAAAAVHGGRFRDAGLAILWGGVLYGAVMGSFAGLTPDRWLQVVYSAAKVPMLLVLATLIALPPYFVLNTLAGLRDDFSTAFKGVLFAQGTVGVVLAALAPLTAVWYCTSGDYHEATTFNGVMFVVACVAAQRTLRRRYAPLIRRRPRHRWLLRLWIVLYVFTGIQLAWTLRPFVGNPATPPSLFRKETFGNAYVIVFDIVQQALQR
jgi:hypothetical protein